MLPSALGTSGSPGGVSQDVTTVQANTDYTLSYWVGWRNDYNFSLYTVSLVVGGVTVASDSAGSPAQGTFQLRTVDYFSNPADAGRTLTIDANATGLNNAEFGAQADFDRNYGGGIVD